MFYLNEVKLIGRATGDAVVKQIGSDSTVATFRLVSNRKIKKRDGTKDEKSTFVDVEVWGQRAEYAGNYIKRGTEVFVQGSLETDEWEKDGQKRSKLKIYGSVVQAAFPKDKERGSSDSSDSRETVKTGASSGGAKAFNDDDVPF